MGLAPKGKGSLQTVKSKTLAELEARGLCCYGLRLNQAFVSAEDPSAKGLCRTKTGKISIELLRNVDAYGGMTCKGFKPGEQVVLKARMMYFLNFLGNGIFSMSSTTKIDIFWFSNKRF